MELVKIEKRKQPTLPANPHSPKSSVIRWREVPMFRLSMAFIPGMIVANLTGIPMVAWLAAFFIPIAIGTGLLISQVRSYRAVIALTLSFFLGGTLITSQEILKSTDFLNKTCGDPYTGTICKITPNASGQRAILNLIPHRAGLPPRLGPVTRLMATHKVLVYFSRPDRNISIGDTIIFSRNIDEILPPKNEFEFNASRYYSSLGIHHQTFLKNHHFAHYQFHGFSLIRSSHKIREIIAHKIKERLPDDSSSAIMIAMLLGDKSNIAASLKTSYSKAGSIHILAISGLHIGIVASILIGVIGLPTPDKSLLLAIFKTLTILIGIWLFTWISGMSPSATRAAFMFTVYLLGVLIRRKAQILNILGFTAIFLLIREPFLLFNLGFQFSFLALSGIVIWGIPLLRAFTFKYRLLQYGWSIIAISIGAQILVAPAILYYFNQISIVSPITSLVAIPAAYIIVVGGIITLIAEMLSPVLSSFIGSILSHGINLINHFFINVSAMPLSTLNHIYITATEVSILAGIILLVSMKLLTRRRIWIKLTVPFSLLFAIFHCHSYLQHTLSPLLTIYASKSVFAFDVISTASTLTTLNPAYTVDYSLEWARRNRLQHYGGIINQINDNTEYPESSLLAIKVSSENAEPLYIIYIGSMPRDLGFITEQVKYVILSKGLDYAAARKLKIELDRLDTEVYDMRKQGAFNLSLI